MSLLDRRISDTQVRYNRAVQNKKKAFHYSLRLRLVIMYGIKGMFLEYANKIGNEIDEMQNSVRDILPAEMYREIYGEDSEDSSDG